MKKSKLHTSRYYLRFFKTIITALIIVVVLNFDIALQHNLVKAEYFSSTERLQKLGDVELDLIKTYRDYLEMQKIEFETYRRFIEHVKMQHSIALEDTEDYLSNPINAFTLIKRLASDWNHLHDYIKESQARTEFREKLNAFKNTKKLPDFSELNNAVKGLTRLQEVYDLHVDDLVDGVINGINYGTKLSWHDCFEIAANLYDQKEFTFALNWFKKSLEKLNEIEPSRKDAIQHKFVLECLEYLVLTNYKLDYTDEAIAYLDELLKLAPDHQWADMRTYLINTPPMKQEPVKKTKRWATYQNYTQLCQGKQLPDKKLNKLKCLLDTRNIPYFMLSPLKIEQLSIDPEINLYHSLLNDVQIDRIVAEAENPMARSQIIGANGFKASEVRVSQQACLNFTSPITRTIYNLVSDITGLDLRNTEIMQIANYGIGENYGLHYDFIGFDQLDKRWIGDRVATNIFYLSHVEQGGYTVFPKINIISRPVKGSLIVWYNLHKSLDTENLILHAGCPVIKGSKRIAYIWVNSGYQEFGRKCSLKSNT